MSHKIMIVDDEKDILSLLCDYFILNDFEVLAASNAKEAFDKIKEAPDIILLDINMPGTDGIEFCKTVRNNVNCPIIFLTARTDSDDILQGLNIGGDDYITKPFNIRELLGRVNAHLRREKRYSDRVKNENAGLKIDYSAMTVAFNGKNIDFTKTQFAIIELLSLNPNRVFDKEKIYEEIKGFDAYGDNTVITEHVRNIRNKFLSNGCKSYIETVWGIGYKWVK